MSFKAEEVSPDATVRSDSAEKPTRPDYLVPIPQICAELCTSSTTIWRMSRDGELPPKIKVGQRVGFSRRALDAWKAERGFIIDGMEGVA